MTWGLAWLIVWNGFLFFFFKILLFFFGNCPGGRASLWSHDWLERNPKRIKEPQHVVSRLRLGHSHVLPGFPGRVMVHM